MKATLLNGRVIFSAFMLGLFTTMVVVAIDYPPKAQLLPFVIGIPGIGFALLQLFLEIRSVGKEKAIDTRTDFEKYQAEIERYTDKPMELDITQEKTEVIVDDTPEEGRSVFQRELILFGFFFALLASVILFGFWITIPLFFIAFMRGHEGDSWRFTLILTAVTLLSAYLIFDKMLNFELHPGFVTDYVLDQIDPDR
jgi:hypothetical protein